MEGYGEILVGWGGLGGGWGRGFAAESAGGRTKWGDAGVEQQPASIRHRGMWRGVDVHSWGVPVHIRRFRFRETNTDEAMEFRTLEPWYEA